MQISSSRSRARSRGRHAASSTLSVRGAVIAALFGSAISLAHAETPSFSALLARAQGSAPQLLEQMANVRAAQADVRQAGAWRNPLFDRNRSGVDAARERANGAALRVEAARLDAVAARRAALAQAAASEQRLKAAEEGETAALEAYRLGRIGYEAGKTPLLELLSIRRALSEAQALTIDTRLARVRALAALSLAEGRLVFGEAP